MIFSGCERPHIQTPSELPEGVAPHIGGCQCGMNLKQSTRMKLLSSGLTENYNVQR